HRPAGVITEPRAAELRRAVLRDRLREDVFVLFLVDLPVRLAADRDLLVLPDVDRADQRLVLDHTGTLGRWRRDARVIIAGLGRRDRPPAVIGLPGVLLAVLAGLLVLAVLAVLAVPAVLPGGLLLLRLFEHVRHRARRCHLAVDPGHQLAAIEVRDLL